MALFSKFSPRSRQSALAVIMLAVLLAGTAAAWVIARNRGGPEDGEQWYILFDGNDQIVGWEVVQRRPDDPHGGSGYHIQWSVSKRSESKPSENLLASQWELNAEATKGTYLSIFSIMFAQGRTGSRRTRIDYDEGVIRLWLSTLREPGRYELDVPPSQIPVGRGYIAEGRLRPTIVQAATTGEAIRGTIVDDNLGKLVTVHIQPVGTRTWEFDGQEAELTEVKVFWLKAQGRVAFLQRYYVDNDGSVPLIRSISPDGSRREHQLVGFDRVRACFPNAPARRTQALDELDTETE